MLLKRLNLAAEAFHDILERCQEHPMFNIDLFEARNIDRLCEIGGEECDWTVLAITAANALDVLEKS
jgi:hypothetical protein